MSRPTSADVHAVDTVTNRRSSLRQSVAQVFRRWNRRRTRKRAFERAYLEFRATHTRLHELCFDRNFLLGRGAEALARRDARALARSWTAGFSYRDEAWRARDIRLLEPPAESFIELLDAHMKQADLR